MDVKTFQMKLRETLCHSFYSYYSLYGYYSYYSPNCPNRCFKVDEQRLERKETY